jgi:hypothetical protein
MIAVAVAGIALPASAGNSWPQVPSVKPPAASARLVPAGFAAKKPQSIDGFVSDGSEAGASLEQYSYFRTEEGRGDTVYAPRRVLSSTPGKDDYAKGGAVNGFEYIGGDGGWQLAGHKYVLSNGRFVHSEECDHTIRAAQAVTPADIEKSQRLSPGA